MNFKTYLFNFENKSYSEINNIDRFNTIDQLILTLPVGVYTTLRTVHKNRIFELKHHLGRLIESINLSGLKFPYKIDEIRDPLSKLIEKFPAKEVRIRLFIPLEEVNKCYIILENLVIPADNDYKFGVKVNTNKLFRKNPKAKLSSFIKNSEKIRIFCKENDLEESIILNTKNELLEGISSNFYAVINGEIYTADKEVLDGVTRRIILDEAQKANISINFLPLTYDQIGIITEAFISSTSRGVLPVISIDSHKINDGIPGKVTKLLMDKMIERMLSKSEEIIQSSSSFHPSKSSISSSFSMED
jgi:branched-chain amino acid aminotransferase